MGRKEENLKKFLYKKSYLDRRLKHDVMENGTAYIPCKVTSIDDIISKFSVNGCESLDSEFLSFITDFVDFIPTEYPVVLQISGAKFNAEEKKIITNTIEEEMSYQLGKTEEFNAIKKRRFIGMIAGTALSGVILTIAQNSFTHATLEFSYVLFWLFADALVRYLFIEKLDFRDEKIRMGRLASMKVEFIE